MNFTVPAEDIIDLRNPGETDPNVGFRGVDVPVDSMFFTADGSPAFYTKDEMEELGRMFTSASRHPGMREVMRSALADNDMWMGESET